MTLTADSRVRMVIWMACCAIISVMCYWYPIIVDNSFGRGFDSRIGFVVFGFLPVLIAVGFGSVWIFWNLMCVVFTTEKKGNVGFGLAACFLLLVSLSPLFMIAFNLLRLAV